MSLTLRPYQQDALETLQGLRAAGRQRGLVHLATGLGKTALAATDALNYRRDQPKARILFVSHMNAINHQAADTFKNVDPGVKTSQLVSGRVPTTPVVFATFQSLFRSLDTFDPAEFAYIIWDEAHHIEATTFKVVREYFQPAFELGLTATPTRADGLDILEYFGAPVYVKTLSEGIAEGWLSPVDYHIVLDDTVKQAIKDGFDKASSDQIRHLFSVRPRNEIIAREVMERRKAIGLGAAKTIVFCHNQKNADQMAALLDGVAYHSAMNAADQTEIMQDFRNGSRPVICTVDMFNEGVDIPDTRLVVFLRSTSSMTIFEQQLGRGLRRHPGKRRVTVLDFVANVERIDFVRDLGHRISAERAALMGTDRPRAVGGAGRLDAPSAFGDMEIPSNFVFEDRTIELLERFKTLQITTPLPEGYMSMSDASKRLGVSVSAIKDYWKRQGWEKVLYQTYHNLPGLGVSPEQFEQLAAYYDLAQAEEVHLIADMVREWGVAYRTLYKWCKKTGVEIGYYRSHTGKLGRGVDGEGYKKLVAFRGAGLPAGYMSLAQAMDKLNTPHRQNLLRRGRILGMTLIKWNGQRYVSPEQFEELKNYKSRKKSNPVTAKQAIAAYKKYASAPKAGKALGVTATVIYKHVRAAGVVRKVLKGGDPVKVLPAGAISAVGLAAELGYRRPDTLYTLARKHGIENIVYMNKGYFTPAEADRIRELRHQYQANYRPPVTVEEVVELYEELESAPAVAERLGVSDYVVYKRLERAGLKAVGVGGRPAVKKGGSR